MIYFLIPLALLILWTTFLAYAAIKAQWLFLRSEVKIVGAFVVLVGYTLDNIATIKDSINGTN